MPFLNYPLYFNRVMELYQGGQYSEAYEFISRYYRLFPEALPQSYYLRFSAAARSGQPEAALRILQAAIGEGYWYAPELILQEPGLDALRDTPEFAAALVACRERQAEVETSADPEMLMIKPEDFDPERSYPLLFGIHANLENARLASEFWVPDFWEGWVTAWVQSSRVRFSRGCYWESPSQGTKEILSHFLYLNEQGTFEPRVIAGFGEGADLALRVALWGLVPAAGLILVGPWLPFLREGLPPNAPAGLRVYVVVGEEDAAGHLDARELATALARRSIPCEVEIRPEVGHVYPPDLESSLMRAMQFILGSEAESPCPD